MTLEQMPTTAGAAFAFPIGDGRFSVCRVLLDPSSHVQRGQSLDWMTRFLDGLRKSKILIACSNWIGNGIPQADDPALRTILHLNRGCYKDWPIVLWISLTEDMPEDFIYIGTIVPSAKEIEINCSVAGSWSWVTRQPLAQWRWDNDRDALLAEEAKQEEYRRARLILNDYGVVIDNHGLTHRGVRLEWEQVREVALEGPDSGYSYTPYLTITSDTGEFTVCQRIKVFPAIVNALEGLPAFPSLEFGKALSRPMWDGKVIIWSRDVTELGADLKPS